MAYADAYAHDSPLELGMFGVSQSSPTGPTSGNRDDTHSLRR